MGDFLTRVYRKGVLEAEGFPIAEVSDHLERPDTVLWVDVSAPTKAQLHQLAEELGLHELAVEDTLGPNQRPKLDRYGTHFFLSCRAVAVRVDAGTLEEVEVDVFVNERWIVTARENEGFPIDPVLHRCDRSSRLAVHGTSFILYGLLDIVVDGYFSAIEAFDEYYDHVSDGIFSEQPLDPQRQRHWFEMRRIMVRFHRLVVPLREAVSSLMRRENAVVPDELYPYYQDIYDHILRVTESSDSLRDLVSTIVETNLSLRDYRQNLIVKKVGSWAAIISVPAVITGYYGMNVPYPGSGSIAGVVASTALMILMSAGLYLLFRKRDWL
ncbi:MAG: magnesium transporter CorA family protein [Acidimicrobiia bacterium]